MHGALTYFDAFFPEASGSLRVNERRALGVVGHLLGHVEPVVSRYGDDERGERRTGAHASHDHEQFTLSTTAHGMMHIENVAWRRRVLSKACRLLQDSPLPKTLP